MTERGEIPGAEPIGPHERALADALRAGLGGVRPGARSGARAAFLAGDSSGDSSGDPRSRPGGQARTARAVTPPSDPRQPLEDALLRVLEPRAGASPAARERTRRAFLAGPGLSRPRRLAPWLAASLAAAAALWLLVGPLSPRAGQVPTWALLTGGGDVHLAGAVLDGGRLLCPKGGAPAGEVRLRCGAQALGLALGEDVRLEFSPGSRGALSPLAVPRRGGALRVELELDFGELVLASSPSARPLSLSVATPDGVVEVLGTVLSVRTDENGTCVCVAEGRASARDGGGRRVSVRAGESLRLCRSGAGSELLEGGERTRLFGCGERLAEHDRRLSEFPRGR